MWGIKAQGLFCDHLYPRGVERGTWPWKRQEAPQGSPKEVTAFALQDAGGTDTAPSPRPQHLVA